MGFVNQLVTGWGHIARSVHVFFYWMIAASVRQLNPTCSMGIQLTLPFNGDVPPMVRSSELTNHQPPTIVADINPYV